MSAEKVKVVDVKVTRAEIAREFLGVFPGLKEMPMAKEKVDIELKGVPTAVANALRRSFDEMRGHALELPASSDDGSGGGPVGFVRAGSTDPFMIQPFVQARIHLIPLRPGIPESTVRNLKLALRARNKTSTPKAVYSGNLTVSAGELTEPLFNPTFEIAVLQPGETLQIEGIYISGGVGREDAAYNVGIRCGLRHLDLEQLPDADVRTKREPNEKGGLDADWSGYKESSLITNPRHHIVTVTIPAVPAKSNLARGAVIDACTNIKERLRYVQTILESETSAREAQFVVVPYFIPDSDEQAVKATLHIKRETDTIGNLLRRAVYELYPEIMFVGYEAVPHEKEVRVTLVHNVSDEDIGDILLRAVKESYATFDSIQRQIRTF